MSETPQPSVAQANPGYASYQLAKALTTSEQHHDAATRERARAKITRWLRVLEGMGGGALGVGSRTPVASVPVWATLEVVTGGFATGALLAEGPLLEHERQLQAELKLTETGDSRRVLNLFYLSDSGIAAMQNLLRTRRYAVDVPEEGALAVVAWLLEHKHIEQAQELLDEIVSFLTRLRFYPRTTEQSQPTGSRVFLRSVGETIETLSAVRPKPRLLAQREAVLVWTPLYDRLVSLFLETVSGDDPRLEPQSTGGWPCQVYPADWSERVRQWLAEFAEARRKHALTAKPERRKHPFAQLRELAARCASDPRSLSGREVGRIRRILAQYLAKHGRPQSAERQSQRERHQAEVQRPLFSEIAAPLVARLQPLRKEEGLDDPQAVSYSITATEQDCWRLPQGTAIPAALLRKVERCLCDTVEILVERGLITSAEVLARLLPQITAEQRAAGFESPELRSLYVAIYRAFRRRRSLLLLNLESQVRLEELPWIRAIEPHRVKDVGTKESARRTLEEVAALAVTSFPHAILPNKLLQEMRALAKDAELDLPLVDELAADIFMGQFSEKFVEAAKQAAELLAGTLYARCFAIDYAVVQALPSQKASSRLRFFRAAPTDALAKLCSTRAGVPLGTWQPATNGMIIEQQQILTTQNLASPFAALGLTGSLAVRLPDMARRSFSWLIARLQVKAAHAHARLIAVKNCAYAWRQMIFYLSLAPPQELAAFLGWAEESLRQQPGDFATRFRPALRGLQLAAAGETLDAAIAARAKARQFLGWSNGGHWLVY